MKVSLVALTVGVIVISAVFYFWFFLSRNAGSKVSMNNISISQKELDLGWYYGGEKDRKPGTPEHWKHEDEGSRSARWFDPKHSAFYTSYQDFRLGEETILRLWQAGKLPGEDFVIIPKSIVAGFDDVTGGKTFAVIFLLRRGDVRDEVRIRSNNEVFTDPHAYPTLPPGKNIFAELGEAVGWNDFSITTIDAESVPEGSAASPSESYVKIIVKKTGDSR